MEVEAAGLGSPSLLVLTVSVDVKQLWSWTWHLVRAQKLCESRGGRPGLSVPNSPYGLCGRKVTVNLTFNVQANAKVGWLLIVWIFMSTSTAQGQLRTNHRCIYSYSIGGRNSTRQNTRKREAQNSAHNTVNSKHNPSKTVNNQHTSI